MASRFSPPFHPSYEGANAYLGNKNEKRISGNTRLVRINENAIGLVLHSTTIVQYRSNGMIIIQTGGWNTPTTRRYINGASPAHLSQMNFQLMESGKPWNGEPLQVA